MVRKESERERARMRGGIRGKNEERGMRRERMRLESGKRMRGERQVREEGPCRRN